MKVKFNVAKNYSSVKTYLKARGFSESLLSIYEKNQHLIKVNSKSTTLESKLIKGSKIEVSLINETSKVVLVNKPLQVVFEDQYLMIVNKPHNMPSTPTKATIQNNLSGIIANYYRNIKLNSKIHLVNRLDAETSGIILVAKHQLLHNLLTGLKIYFKFRAKLVGKIKPESGIIEKRIAKLEGSKERVETIKGTNTITKYDLKHFENNESNIEAELVSGKSPQLRLHFKLMGYPIVGDKLYGGKGKILYLQNFFIKFKHPITKRVISVKLKKEWN
jgi:23S rRNA pseudouridine1911/1915/1917 synthase